MTNGKTRPIVTTSGGVAPAMMARLYGTWRRQPFGICYVRKKKSYNFISGNDTDTQPFIRDFAFSGLAEMVTFHGNAT